MREEGSSRGKAVGRKEGEWGDRKKERATVGLERRENREIREKGR